MLTLAVALLAGCGGSDSDVRTVTAPAVVILDTKRVEHAIEDSILKQRGVKADVDCPSGVHQAKGLSFDCVATTATGHTTFAVQQGDAKGNVTYAAR